MAFTQFFVNKVIDNRMYYNNTEIVKKSWILDSGLIYVDESMKLRQERNQWILYHDYNIWLWTVNTPTSLFIVNRDVRFDGPFSAAQYPVEYLDKKKQ